MGVNKSHGFLGVREESSALDVDRVAKLVFPDGSLTGTEDGEVKFDPSLPGEFASFRYASLSAAVTAIGATVGTLRISTPSFSNGSTTTVPATLKLEPVGNGSILMDTGETVTIVSDNKDWPVRQLFFNALPGIAQLETATVVGGVSQVETATVVGTISTAGNVSIIVTAAGMSNSPKTILVPVLLSDSASTVAGEIRRVLTGTSEVRELFTVSGTGADVVLTTTVPATNDATLNINIGNGTAAGLTPDATSDNTTAGVAAITTAGNVTVIVTAAGMTGSPKTLNVAVALDDTSSQVAGKIRTSLRADVDVSALYLTSGSGSLVILTKKVNAANDATLNVSIDNGTSVGLTAALTSANTTAGVAPQGAILFTGNKVARDFHIEWWGGAGDGATNNSPMLQAAVNAIVSIGAGNLFFSGADYRYANEVKIGSTTGGGDGLGAFTSVNLYGVGVTTTKFTWIGPTSETMLKYWRNKYSITSQFVFINAMAKGTTIGTHLTGPASGTQSLNLNFLNCSWQLFNIGLLAGGGPLGTEAASELMLDTCSFSQNNIGFQAGGSGNTINIWFDGTSFSQNTLYGADFGVGGSVFVDGGGSNANGLATFKVFGAWQGPVEIAKFRFELTPPEIAIDGGNPETLLVRTCQFKTNSTVPIYPVIRSLGSQVHLDANAFGHGAQTGWVTISVALAGNPQFYSLTMTSNKIYGSQEFYVDPNVNGLRYALFNNAHQGGATSRMSRTGLVVAPNMVDDLIRGSATFATAATKAVTITTRESTAYDVLIEKAVNEDIWVTGKTTTGFTLNSSNATSTAVINYVIRRQ